MDPIAREELIDGHRAEFRADPGGGYVVQFPYLPGCVTEGDTIEEARAAAAEALAVYLEAYREGSKERSGAPLAESEQRPGAPWVVIDCLGFEDQANGADAIGDVFVVADYAAALAKARELLAEREAEDAPRRETGSDDGYFDPVDDDGDDDDVELHGPAGNPFGFFLCDRDGFIRVIGKRTGPRGA